MTQTEGVPAVQFEGYTFDEVSGELTGPGNDGAETHRLPPQPAKLLGHLIRKQPEIASLNEIRDLLWPDVQVEFEKSLHTCVRKIRVALGDSASKPRFVETVPRRGYRFLVEARAMEKSPNESDLRGPIPDEHLRGQASTKPELADGVLNTWRRPIVGIVIAATVLLALLLWRLTGGPSPTSYKVAIMPFEPVAVPSALAPNNGFAESLVETLVAEKDSPLDIIGPTTTHGYPEHTGALGRWIESDGIDYVINGRELEHDGRPRLLVEIIRGHDGAHVWARYLDELPNGNLATAVIAGALAEEIAHPRQRRE